jgi:hypothetical protein
MNGRNYLFVFLKKKYLIVLLHAYDSFLVAKGPFSILAIFSFLPNYYPFKSILQSLNININYLKKVKIP